VPFVYGNASAPGAPYTTSATPNVEDPTVVLRQITRGFDLQGIAVHGRGAALTTMAGIGYRVRRWTTAGSGGLAMSASPRRIGTTPTTNVLDKSIAITPGTVSGAYQLSFGCSGAGPGGWYASSQAVAIHVEGGGSDELDVNSVGGVASMPHEVMVETVE
jgi:hypothetical protein